MLWQQTLVTAAEAWETQLTLGASISSLLLQIPYAVTWNDVDVLLVYFTAFSISSTVCFTSSAVWDRLIGQTSAHTARCNSRVESVWCNAEMVGHTNDSRRGRKPWSCTAEMSWLSREIHIIIFYCIRCVVSTAARLIPLMKRSYCRCYMSLLDCFHFLL